MNTNNSTVTLIPVSHVDIYTRKTVGAFKSEHIIAVPAKRGGYARFGIGGWDETTANRMVCQGPKVVGPVAYAFQLCTVIDTRGGTGAEREKNLAEKTEHNVNDGETLSIDGNDYLIGVWHQGYETYVSLTNIGTGVCYRG